MLSDPTPAPSAVHHAGDSAQGESHAFSHGHADGARSTARAGLYRRGARRQERRSPGWDRQTARDLLAAPLRQATDRKSTRLNSSHEWISYAVFCLKKKKNE